MQIKGANQSRRIKNLSLHGTKGGQHKCNEGRLEHYNKTCRAIFDLKKEKILIKKSPLN